MSETTRPSDDRRNTLKSTEGNLEHVKVSNFLKIDSYYSTADKVYDNFHSRYEQCCNTNDIGDFTVDNERLLDDAYTYGRRYCMFVSQVLPQHDYFKSSQSYYLNMRKKVLRNLNVVIERLERIADLMDLQEISRGMIQREEEEAMKALESKCREEELERKLRNLIPRAPEQDELNDDTSLNGIEQCHLPPPSYEDFVSNENDHFHQLPSAPPESNIHINDSCEKNDTMPSCPPSVPFAPSLSVSLTDWGLPDNRNSTIENGKISKEFRTIQSEHISQFFNYKTSKRISAFKLSTYQGKYAGEYPERDSTNGCTVIAAMIALNHLALPWNRPIPNSAIESVIDIDAPPILRKVRAKLGLMGDALIIPSDVNDYLVERNLLKQDQFVGVCGGNILDEKHLDSLLLLLEYGHNGDNSEKKKAKVAATLFFHEHVVCLFKSYTHDGDVRYEIVDSLPRVLHQGEVGSAIRVRCMDVEGFKVALRWYTSSKFSESNCEYIDRYCWDETNCDFDPRVFQAFVWSNAEC